MSEEQKAQEKAQEPATKEPEQKQLSPEEMAQELDALRSKNRELLHEVMDKKDKYRSLQTEIEKQQETQMKEQQKWKELYEQAIPKAKRLEEVEPVIQNLLEMELQGIPEDKRDLVPEFPQVESKLKWIREAKTKGLFKGAESASTTPPASVQSKINTSSSLPEFVTWGKSDPRLMKLSIPEYKLYKQHNTQPNTKQAGWGG